MTQDSVRRFFCWSTESSNFVLFHAAASCGYEPRRWNDSRMKETMAVNLESLFPAWTIRWWHRKCWKEDLQVHGPSPSPHGPWHQTRLWTLTTTLLLWSRDAFDEPKDRTWASSETSRCRPVRQFKRQQVPLDAWIQGTNRHNGTSWGLTWPKGSLGHRHGSCCWF